MTGPVPPSGFGKYDDYIYARFIADVHCGIDLLQLGPRTYDTIFPVDLKNQPHLSIEKFKEHIAPVISFICKFYANETEGPIWHKINVLDNAINHFMGIGVINLQGNWIDFIVTYLLSDRADQSGDTLITLFDMDFKWAVCFTLSQDHSCLQVEKYEKKSWYEL